MKDCASADRIVSSWVETGEMSESDRLALLEHLSVCPECSGSEGALMPLLYRDAGEREALRVMHAVPAGASDRVMQAMAGTRLRTPRFGGPRGASLVAVAAVLLLFVAGGLIAYRAGRARGGESAGGAMVVRFELAAPEARSVFLVGDFTDWQESGLALTDGDGDGLWEAAVRLRKGRAYAYNFLIDGEQWIVDPRASVNVDDGFGGLSSVIVL